VDCGVFRLSPGAPASHKLAKQGYFPAGDGYHLLSPLFATSLVHAMHQKMVALRFGDEVKAIWKARRENLASHSTNVIPGLSGNAFWWY
jgi:hypothetical protein